MPPATRAAIKRLTPGCVVLALLLICAIVGISFFAQLFPTNLAGRYFGSVTVTINKNTPIGVSQFVPGMTNSNTNLFDPWAGNNHAAVQRALGLIGQGLSFVNVHMMAWGAEDPWPDPAKTEPDNWASLDRKMQVALKTHTTPVLTLCEAPWWMKGRLNANGTTTLLSSNDDFSDIAYESRILDNKMDDWLKLVQRVAERYMVAPYNVRYFQVWNELKGYYNPATNNWDVSTSAGDSRGPNAKHGYTYMYNRVYTTLKEVASENGIDPATIKVGGPYATIDTLSSFAQSDPSRFVQPYGVFDQRSLDAVTYWLKYKIGAEFITIDGSMSNDDNIVRADAFTAARKFADMVHWIRSLDPAIYPGATTLPIWWAEWYADPYSQSASASDNALKSFAMIELLKAGGAVALAWDSAALWTSTANSNGGQPLDWYFSYKAFKDYFGPGTTIYQTNVSSNKVEALASPRKTMLVNKTNTILTVSVDDTSVVLFPYGVRVIDTP